MRVKFKGKNLDIKNESDKRSEFSAIWKGYTIEVTPYDTHYYSNGTQKLKYEATCINPLGEWICDTVTCDTIKEGAQECFESISIDVDDLKSEYGEIGECLKLFEEYQ